MRTFQRWRQRDGSVREDARPAAKRLTPKNKIADAEGMRILETINHPEFAYLPPRAIVPILADGKVFIGSEGTMEWAMKEARQLFHRGKAQPIFVRKPSQPMVQVGSGARISPGYQDLLEYRPST